MLIAGEMRRKRAYGLLRRIPEEILLLLRPKRFDNARLRR